MTNNDNLNYVVYRKPSIEEWNAFVKKHQDEWIRTGNMIKTCRETLRISKAALARDSGICAKTLSKLENGKYIRRFKTVARSCMNALTKIYLREREKLNGLIE